MILIIRCLPLFLLLLCWAETRAEVRREVMGPINLRGVQIDMQGPFVMKTIEFDRPGWIRRFSGGLLDLANQPVKDTSVFCHLSLQFPHGFPHGVKRKYWNVLTIGEGMPEIKFPDGFGVSIDSGSKFQLYGMLKSDSPTMDKDYIFEMLLDVISIGAGPALKNLEQIRIPILAQDSDAAPISHDNPPRDWWVPPGVHEYKHHFHLESPGRIHFMVFHVHRHARKIQLRNLNDGNVLFDESTAENNQKDLIHIPYYSSTIGIPVDPKRELEFAVTYDNPLKDAISGMGIAEIYLNDDQDSAKITAHK